MSKEDIKIEVAHAEHVAPAAPVVPVVHADELLKEGKAHTVANVSLLFSTNQNQSHAMGSANYAD